jgi:hypothetical protein
VTGHDGKLVCLQPRSSTNVTSRSNYNFTGERQKSVIAIKVSPDSVFYLLVRCGLQTAQPSTHRSFHRPVRVKAAWRQFTSTGEIYEACSTSRASSEFLHLLSPLCQLLSRGDSLHIFPARNLMMWTDNSTSIMLLPETISLQPSPRGFKK